MAAARRCNINTCKRSSLALCSCCQQYLCINHLHEHSDFLNAQLTPLADEINQLFDQFNHVSLLEPTFLIELDKWRHEAHQVVDQFYDRKKQQCDEFLYRQRDKYKTHFDQLKNDINELIREQGATQEDIDSINNSIRSLEQQTNQLQLPHLTLIPLTIDDQLVLIDGNVTTSKNLLPLSAPSRTIKVDCDWYSIAANDDHLLVILNNKLCLLDQHLIVQREIPWTHNGVWDMFWSLTLAQFVLVTPKEIFTLDEKTMGIKQFPTFRYSNRLDWNCGTCLNDKLFLSTLYLGSSIYEYTLRPTIQLVKESRPPLSCTKDEYITDLSLAEHALALIIANNQDEVRLDLCFPATLERYWSIAVGSMSGFYRARCCSVNNDQWLVINSNSSEFFHISADGKLIKIETYKPLPFHAIQLNINILAILTKESINLHQLS